MISITIDTIVTIMIFITLTTIIAIYIYITESCGSS